jgi:hypothetical protein
LRAERRLSEEFRAGYDAAGISSTEAVTHVSQAGKARDAGRVTEDETPGEAVALPVEAAVGEGKSKQKMAWDSIVEQDRAATLLRQQAKKDAFREKLTNLQQMNAILSAKPELNSRGGQRKAGVVNKEFDALFEEGGTGKEAEAG